MHNPEDNTFQDTLRDGSMGPRIIQLLGYTFTMGSDDAFYPHDRPAREVRVDEFFIGKFAITFDEYDRYCESTGIRKPPDNGLGRKNFPVTNVSWTESNKYCCWLSEQTGKHYRLPTEAEWECACGAGNPFAFWFGNNPDDIVDYAWVFDPDKIVQLPQPVGQKRPNPWGLYDMYGNVWEWTSGMDNGRTSIKVARGGCAMSFDFECPTYHRVFFDKERLSSYIGFRIARDKDSSEIIKIS